MLAASTLTWDSFQALTVAGIKVGSDYGLVAVGFALILGVTGRFHFAYGILYTLAAYMSFTYYDRVGLPFWVSSVLGLATVVLLALAIEHYIYRPLAMRAGATALLAIFVAALGLTIAGVNLIQLLWGSNTKSFRGIRKHVYFAGKPIAMTNYEVYSVLSAIVLVAILAALLRFTGLGRAIKATRVNPELATVIGIDSRIIYLTCFGIGTFLAGVNAFWSSHRYSVTFDMGLRPTIYAFVVAFLAGTASSPVRVFVTGVVIGLLENYVSIKLSLQWQQTAVFVVLMFYLIYKSSDLRRVIGRLGSPRPAPSAP